jgi:hypothetical protein
VSDPLGDEDCRVDARRGGGFAREPHLRVNRVEAAAAGNGVDDDRDGI